MVYKGVDAGNGTTTYHLKVLETNGFIKSIKKDFRIFYFKTGVKFPYKLQSTLSFTELEILKALRSSTELSVSRVAMIIDKSVQTASYNIKQLERMKFVESFKENQQKICRITEKGEQYLTMHLS